MPPNPRDWVAQGISIIPIKNRSKGKEPMLAKGEREKYEHVPADSEQIARWESQNPDGWAALGGKASGGLYCVDIDSPDAGHTAVYQLLAPFGETYTVRSSQPDPTKGGKLHLYYRDSSASKLKSHSLMGNEFNDPLISQTDLLADGKYWLLPGSKHPKDPDGYQVVRDVPVRELPIEKVWFILRTLKHWPIVRAVADHFKRGQMHFISIGLGAYLFHHAFTAEEAAILMSAVCYACGDPDVDHAKAVGDLLDTYTRANDGVEVGYREHFPDELTAKLEALPKSIGFGTLAMDQAMDRLPFTPVTEPEEPVKPESKPEPTPEPETKPESKKTKKTKKNPHEKTPEEKEAERKAEEERVRAQEAFDAEVRPMTYDMIRDIFKAHLVLPEEQQYDEALLLSCQYRLKDILPPKTVANIAFIGEFSAGKSYGTDLVTFISGGKMIVDPSAAGIVRLIEKTPGITLGIDEVDELIKKEKFIESILRYSNEWTNMKPLNVPDGAGGWEVIEVQVGGMRVFNGYNQVDRALMSRTLAINIERHKNIDKLVEKMLGYPNMLRAKRWLELRCEEKKTKWTQMKVMELMRSKEFKDEASVLISDEKVIPRSAEIVLLILVLGRILDIDTKGIISRYLETSQHLSEKAEFHADVITDVFLDIQATQAKPNGEAFIVSFDLKKSEYQTIHIDAVARRAQDGTFEVLSTSLLGAVNARMTKLGQQPISNSYWPHCLSELNFQKGRNWIKERSRTSPFYNRWYLRFDASVLSVLGVS